MKGGLMKHARKDYNDLAALDRKIPKDEPVFLIRGQDLLAPGVLRHYADEAKRAGVDPRIARSVRAQAKRMEAWRKHKLPDLP